METWSTVRYPDEPDAIHLVLTADGEAHRRIKVTRDGNPAMYHFFAEHAVVVTRPRPDS